MIKNKTLLTEFEIINEFLPLAKGSDIAHGFKDDVARIEFDKENFLIVSKDTIAEDVHFRKNESAYSIAYRLLASNLSDIASSGSMPLYYMISFSYNEGCNKEFLKDFVQGLKVLSNRYNIILIGGDSVKVKGKLSFTLTIFGRVNKNRILSKSNAKNHELIYCSGFIGDAYLGLKILDKQNVILGKKEKDLLVKKYYYPEPRISLGKELSKLKMSNCATDISDGLLIDLRGICIASNVSANIYLNKIPISKEAKIFIENNKKFSTLDLISGGDDYELIFSCNEKNKDHILSIQKKLNVKLTQIGYFYDKVNSDTVSLYDKSKKLQVPKYGYQH